MRKAPSYLNLSPADEPELQIADYIDGSVVQEYILDCIRTATQAFQNSTWDKIFWNLSSLFNPHIFQAPILRLLESV